MSRSLAERREQGISARRRSRLKQTRIAFVAFGTIVLSAMATFSPVLATPACYDPNSGTSYDQSYFFVQVDTECPQTNCSNSYVYQTEGGKGNISTEGIPYLPDANTQNVNEYLESVENPAVCTASYVGNQCSIQIGWQMGNSLAPTPPPGAPPHTCNNISSGETAVVYIEIFDDTGPNSCTRQSFGTAPSNASYDARYYGTVNIGGKTLYQYNAYFEVPGSGNIQWLGYGDYIQQNTAEIAASEVYAPNFSEVCPRLGENLVGHWNYHGEPASQSTFADNMNLYTGSWNPWISTNTKLFEVDPPYVIQPVSNFANHDFTEWKTGGQ